jgi:citrate synthase
MADFLTAAEAARRLGVKPATLYAYVSRGVLSRGKAADGRASLFNAGEVERLARRGRPRRPAGVADITVESAITEITGDSLRFRGLDATRLAVSRTFEEVAELLWTGELGSAREPWQARSAALAAGRAAIAALARVAGMVRGAGEAIFAVARTAGWIAHALEAYAGPGPLRPRAVYIGRPAAGGP